MATPRSPRRSGERFPDVGGVFRVTLFTERRVGHLRPFPIARIAVGALMASDAEKLSETLAWAVLPDQVQWLFVLGDFTTLSATVKQVKARCEAEIVPRIMLPSPLWQPAFAEERLPDRDAADPVAEAIVTAPVQAGHAESLAAWPHWDTSLEAVFARVSGSD